MASVAWTTPRAMTLTCSLHPPDQLQEYYPKILLTAIVLELAGATLFVFGSSLGAYALVRSTSLACVT